MVAQPQENIPMYELFFLEKNKLGSDGVKSLGKAGWLELVYIDSGQ